LLKFFKILEKNNIIKDLRYKNTTVWINLKNYLYSKSLKNVIKLPWENKHKFVNLNFFILLFLSLKNYLKNIFNKSSILYVGAGSGLFEYKNKVLDAYLPKEIENQKIIYMLSAEYPDKLIKFKKYLEKNRIIIYSFLITPIKIILAKIIIPFIKINKRAIEKLQYYNIDITSKEIKSVYAKFIAGYYLYKIFLFPFNIKKAYIVSAYTNSELVSVLKEKGVEIIEIQHGLIGSMHRGYNYAVKDKLLPTPDKIYVYNDFWKEELINAGYFDSKQIMVAGRLQYDLVDKSLVIDNNRFVVFTGQGGFYDKIEEFFSESIDFLKEKNIKLIYLPHPNEDKVKLKYLKNKFENNNLKILIEKKYITEQYIYNSIAHISVYSSCHFDAIHYKNKTYIFDIMKDNPMEYYITTFPEKFIPIKHIWQIKELN